MSSVRPVTRTPDLDGIWQGRNDVVVIAAANGWAERRMADRQLAGALAQHAPVLYVDPATSLVSRLRSDGIAASRRRTPVTVVHDRLVRLSPHGIPGLSRPGIARLNRSVVASQVRSVLTRAGGRVHAHVEANMLSPTMALVPARTRVFWAQDDFVGMAPLISVSPTLLAASVNELATTADFVIAANPAVVTSLPGAARVRLVPFGCDVDLFAMARSLPAGGSTHPTAILMGTLNDRLDVSLLHAVVDAGVALLLVGPRSPRWPSTAFDDLLRRPEVRWLGPVDFDDLPRHLATADVGLVPYTHSRFNEGSFPLKTLEYLAAGLPVVATDLPAIRWLASPHVAVADNPTAFAAAVRACCTDPNPTLAQARSTEAARHSWARRAEAFADALGLARG